MTPQEKQAQRAARQAEKATRVAEREERAAEMEERLADREEREANREEREADREEREANREEREADREEREANREEKKAVKEARVAAKEERRVAREEGQAAKEERRVAREEKKAVKEERVAAREERRDERAGRDFQKCVQKALPAAIQSMRDACIKNPGGPSCKAMLDGNYPVCVSVSYLRGKPPTKAELDCGAAYLSCKEDLLPNLISQQAARCAANPAGQDCKDIALKLYPRCASCGEY